MNNEPTMDLFKSIFGSSSSEDESSDEDEEMKTTPEFVKSTTGELYCYPLSIYFEKHASTIFNKILLTSLFFFSSKVFLFREFLSLFRTRSLLSFSLPGIERLVYGFSFQSYIYIYCNQS